MRYNAEPPFQRITAPLKNGNDLTPTAHFSLIAYMFLVTGTMGFLQSFVPLYMTASGIGTAQFGIISAVATGLAMLIQPILGRWSDERDARRPFMAGAALLAGLAYFLFRHADGFVIFTLLSALGVNSFQYLNVAPAVIIARMRQSGTGDGAKYVNYRVWGSVGYVVVAMGMGWAVNSALPAGAKLTRAGLDPLFLFAPLLYVVIAVLCRFVPDAKSRTVAASPDAPIALRHDAAARTANLNNFLFSMFLYNFALYGSSAFLPIYMRQLNATPLQITTMFAGGVVCEIIVMLIAGRWSDRGGRRPPLLFALLTMPVRLLLYMSATTPVHVMLVQLMHGLNFGVVGTIAPVFVNDLADDATRGSAQARLSAVNGLGLALGPLICGQIAARAGMPTMFLVMAGFGAAGAAWFALRVRESHPDLQPSSLR